MVPVSCYGTDVYAWDDGDTLPFINCQTQAWRRMLRVGGRAPLISLYLALAIDCVTITWRVQRAGLFLRMANSPAGSLQQIAMLTFRSLESKWYTMALADLRLVAPDLAFAHGSGHSGAFLHSTGH